MTIDANPDTPGTRCTEVRADQRLRVVNTSNMSPFIGLPVVVLFANYRPRVVQVGSAITFDRPFGQVLAVGDHFVYFAAPRGTICSALAPAYCFGHGYAAEVLLR